ncbi:hypothetical protein N7U66_08485 [Lacinutrix neustonica]|uniref:Glycine zipper family protein n=1 Tax=Lacinutrix neustonica TaxID=2980107 RepID=A0A9E8MZ10_9FLAO|nr:hypothetical protein [Lacinutrix neustonica]WAC03504.1 hypothetical protein N7U66_08485 [Lacinutrix neustonica]
MKYLIFTIFLVLSINVSAQNKIVDTNIFIRIYNLDGKKINKGTIKSISETSIELYLKGKTISVPLSKIGKIKTKRSGGNNVAKGALIGGGSLALLGLISGDDDPGIISFSATDKAAVGLIGGGLVGAGIGGITTIFKKSKFYIIDGNEMKLKDFKVKINDSVKEN